MSAPKRPYSYLEKASKQVNPTAREFLELVDRKKTNLCISLDLVDREQFLKMADALGPYVCLVKVGVCYLGCLKLIFMTQNLSSKFPL